MTDPMRTSDPIDSTRRLPEGCALIYRHFGADDKEDTARTLRQISFARNLQFLIGDDPDLAIKTGADGVHFRRDQAASAPMLWRARMPDWLITMAGLKAPNSKTRKMSYSGDLTCLDGLIISSIFPSRSPTAGPAMGVGRFKDMIKDVPAPAFALGGLNKDNAGQLIGSGAAGIAAVEGLSGDKLVDFGDELAQMNGL